MWNEVRRGPSCFSTPPYSSRLVVFDRGGKSSASFSQPVTYGWLRELPKFKANRDSRQLAVRCFPGWVVDNTGSTIHISRMHVAHKACKWSISNYLWLIACLFFTVDQETMCAGFNSSLESQNMTLLDCNVECCSGNNCNIQNLTTREYTPDTLVDVSGTSD